MCRARGRGLGSGLGSGLGGGGEGDGLRNPAAGSDASACLDGRDEISYRMAVAIFLGTTLGILDVFSTRPVLLPPLPNGAILDIRESFDLPSAVTKTERGGAIWPAAELMCRWLGDEPDRILGARIMELGAGTGACGLYAAALGADSVLLTDGRWTRAPRPHPIKYRRQPAAHRRHGRWRRIPGLG